MKASRRLAIAVSVLAISSVSCGVLPLAVDHRASSRGPLTDLSAEFSEKVATAARALGQLHTGLHRKELSRLAVTIAAESERAGIPVELILGIIRVESSGYNFALSAVGAMGLMQLMPSTAQAVADRAGIRWGGRSTLFDPAVNVRLGVDYLRELIDRYGSVETALAAYNWGPSRIAERIRLGQSVPATYSDKVMGAARSTKTTLL
jgi:soluble lytic murein transglycosylase-like protein